MINIYQSSFPSDDVSREKKNTDEYGKAIAQAIYGRWFSTPYPYGAGGNPYGNLSYFNTVKAYAEGRQSPDRYRKQYRGENAKNGTAAGAGNQYSENQRKGYNNIGFDQNSIVSSAPMFIATIKALLTQSDYKVVVSSNSYSSIKEKNIKKWKMYLDAKLFNPLKKELGLAVQEPDFAPQTKAELELYENINGFRLPLETALSMIAEHGFDISDWNKVRDKMLDAGLQTAFMCGRVKTHNDGSVRVEYLNPAYYVTVYDDNNPELDPPFAGYIQRVPIYTIKAKMPNISDEELKGIARMYTMANGVADPNIYNWENRDPVTARYLWYDFLIDVMHFEYKSDDAKHFVGRKASNGNYVYKQEDRVKKTYADGRERKTDTFYEQVIYEGYWILNTKHVYDYGLQKNMMRDSDGCVTLSYFHERMAGRRVVERWVSLLDDQAMATYKLRAAVLAAAPKGLAIDVGILSNVDFGLGKSTALEIARVRRETGNQFFASRFEVGQRYNNASAITELQNGIGSQLDEWLTYQVHIEATMQRVAGLTDAAVATPMASAEKLKGVAQMEIDTTNNALNALRFAIMRMKEKAAKKMIQKVRVNIAGDPKCKKYYKGVLGDMFFAAVDSVETLSLESIGIKLKATTTVQRKAYIMGILAESLKAGKNGQVGVTSADAMFVERLLEDGYDELAQKFIIISEERVAKQIQANQERMSAINAENQIKSAQAAEQMKTQQMQVVSQLKQGEDTAKIGAQLQADLMKIEAQKNADLETMTLEGSLQAMQGREITGKI